jgi:hypothetical protein
LEAFYNKHFSKWRNVVENAFGILKKTFRKLLVKSNLCTIFFLDVVTSCCLLYNMILDGRDVDVNVLMQQLEQEDMQGAIRRCQHHRMDAGHNEGEVNLESTERSKSNQRMTLETYLGNRRTHRK